MKLSDTHCHLDLYDDPARIAAETEARGIRTIAVTTTPSVFKRSAELTRDATYLRTALGFHPELAASRSRELPLFKELAPTARYIGEVGLDFTKADANEQRIQEAVFRGVLDACASGGKLLTIHSRNAVEQTIEAVGRGFRSLVILHWYTGSLRLIDVAAERGFYFSVNAAMTRSERGRRVIAALPRHRVLLESDGPFVKIGDRPATPSDGEIVVRTLAVTWGMSDEDAAAAVDRNFREALSAVAPS
jgi:TatD DNase family protein